MNINPSRTPLPASATKHLDELRHILPGKNGEACEVVLKQASRGRTTTTSTSVAQYIVYAATDTSATSSSGPDVARNAKDAGSTGTTGTTLWLGAQIMSIYLQSILPSHAVSSYTALPARSKREDPSTAASTSTLHTLGAAEAGPVRRKRAVELGSGIGYLALYLAARGYDVMATDIEPSLSMVLWPNLQSGLDAIRTYEGSRRGKEGLDGVGDVKAQELDWMESPTVGEILEETDSRVHDIEGRSDAISEDQQQGTMEGTSKQAATRQLEGIVGDGLDMIITTDTFYEPSIIKPLWNTIYHLSHLSVRASARTSTTSTTPTARSNHPPIYIALENRDPTLIATALAQGTSIGFELRRVQQSKISKALKEAGWAWNKEDWEGVEVWKGVWRGKK